MSGTQSKTPLSTICRLDIWVIDGSTLLLDIFEQWFLHEIMINFENKDSFRIYISGISELPLNVQFKWLFKKIFKVLLKPNCFTFLSKMKLLCVHSCVFNMTSYEKPFLFQVSLSIDSCWFIKHFFDVPLDWNCCYCSITIYAVKMQYKL